MRSSDRAVVRHALREAAPLALLAAFGCAAMELQWLERWADIDVPRHSTWPLLPLAAIAAWAGIAVFGEFRGTLAHALARPLDRGRLLGVRAAVFVVALASVGAAFVAFVGRLDAGPPLGLMSGFCLLAFGAGALAGASTDTETHAVGATLVGVAVAAAPVVAVFDFYVVAWPRVASALGPWLWPAGLLGVASMAAPTWWVVRALPQRPPRRIAAAVGAVVVFQLLAFGLVWQPTASRATLSVHGETLAIDGVVDGPRVVFTGEGGAVDGVYVDRDDTRVPIYGEGAQRDLVVDAKLSPDGEAIALLVRPSRVEKSRIVLIDLNSGERVATEFGSSLRLGAWAPEAHEMAFMGRFGPNPIRVVSLERGGTRVLPRTLPKGYRRILGWYPAGIVVDQSKGLFLVPAEDHGSRRTTQVLGRTGTPSASGVAWIERRSEQAKLAGDTRRTLKIQGWETGAEPTAVDLEAWPETKVSGLGFLDPDHVFVQFTEWDAQNSRLRTDRPRRLYIVHRSGEVRAAVERDQGFQVHSMAGPPEGPWLATGVYGTLHVVGRDGRSLSRMQARNLGGRSFRWIPVRAVEGGIALIEDGDLATLFMEDFQ